MYGPILVISSCMHSSRTSGASLVVAIGGDGLGSSFQGKCPLNVGPPVETSIANASPPGLGRALEPKWGPGGPGGITGCPRINIPATWALGTGRSTCINVHIDVGTRSFKKT